jgi:CRP/FNR family transcriptional regulator, cyclic AMP receptor protein
MHETNSVAPHNSILQAVTRQNEAFCNLTGEAKTRFASLGIERIYRRGETVFREGEVPQYVFMLQSGRVKLSVSSREGRTVILRIADPGQVLGLNSALAGSEHEASAEALEPCRIVAIPVRDFLRFLETYPDAAVAATRCVLNEYQMIFSDICRLALPTTVAGRLANLLLVWLKRSCHPGQAPRLTVALTHGEIADLTGTSRETVSRTLQQFQRDRVIRIKGASLTVLRPEALEHLAV